MDGGPMAILSSIYFGTVLAVTIGLFVGLVEAIANHRSKGLTSRRQKELKDRLLYLKFLRGAQHRFLVVAREIRGVGSIASSGGGTGKPARLSIVHA